MSDAKKRVAVTRNYEPAPDDCAPALALFLEASVRQEAAPTSRPDDAKARSNEFRAKTILP
jgi:hypothetical protein